MTEIQTKHVYILTVDSASLLAARTDHELASTILCLTMFYQAGTEVKRPDGAYVKKEWVG